MFIGLSAFPITPFKQGTVDFTSFEKLIDNLITAEVDSVCAAGSTGLYPYLNNDELFQVTHTAVNLSSGIPVMAGVGAVSTRDVLNNIDIVQRAGANAVLLAPVSYHRLKDSEVLSLYKAASSALSVPLCVYENPGVTGFTFSDTLYAEISRLPNIKAVKIPGTPFGNAGDASRLTRLRAIVPEHVSIGVSGDKFGAAGMAAGCDCWLSVIGGLFPRTVLQLITLARSDPRKSLALSASLEPLWALFTAHKGGMRVMATAASILGYAEADCLPAPLQTLQGKERHLLENVLASLPLR